MFSQHVHPHLYRKKYYCCHIFNFFPLLAPGLAAFSTFAPLPLHSPVPPFSYLSQSPTPMSLIPQHLGTAAAFPAQYSFLTLSSFPSLNYCCFLLTRRKWLASCQVLFSHFSRPWGFLSSPPSFLCILVSPHSIHISLSSVPPLKPIPYSTTRSVDWSPCLHLFCFYILNAYIYMQTYSAILTVLFIYSLSHFQP